MKRVYLISCTKSKKDYKCCAEEMYKTCNLFNYSLEYACKQVSNKYEEIYILSAKYHLLSLPKVIEPYECTLKDMSSKEKEEWGFIVYKQLDILFDLENTEFIFLAEDNYIEPLAKYLLHWVNPIPKEERAIGKRMHWLKQQMFQNKENLIEWNQETVFVHANELRNKQTLEQIDCKPGYYKWWAQLNELKKLLNSSFIEKEYLEDIISYLSSIIIDGEKYYCIYVGIATKESIQNRLDWHVNQKHSISSVKSGFLSTLRQSISSLLAENQLDEESTNWFIDKLIIEIHPVSCVIGSQQAKLMLENIEKEELKNHIFPLNIKDNKNPVLNGFHKELKEIRKKSKQIES